MKIFPTLNIQQGRVITTTGRTSPSPISALELAAWLMERGASKLALVDVDAALGKGNNRELLAQIMKLCHTKEPGRGPCIQVAGGIRSSDQAQYFLDHGASWLVVGTILHKSPMVAEQLLGRFQNNLTAAIDARGGQVHNSGWCSSLGIPAEQLAKTSRERGFKRLLFVDIPEVQGAPPDYDTAKQLVEASRLPLLMGGSLTNSAHLMKAMAIPGLHGTIVDALLFVDDPKLMGLLQPACA